MWEFIETWATEEPPAHRSLKALFEGLGGKLARRAERPPQADSAPQRPATGPSVMDAAVFYKQATGYGPGTQDFSKLPENVRSRIMTDMSKFPKLPEVAT